MSSDWRAFAKVSANKTLDKIIQKLQYPCSASKVLLLVTPYGKDRFQFKLHIIDCLTKDHRGVTTITDQELSELMDTKFFQQHVVIVTSKYVNPTIGIRSAMIQNFLSTVDFGSCYPKMSSVTNPKFKCVEETELRAKDRATSTRFTSSKLREEESLLVPSFANTQAARRWVNLPLPKLIERINNAPEPQPRDLRKFFKLAERYKFRICIRPELCWTDSMSEMTDTDSACEYVLPRFRIECFTLFDSYVGAISMDTEGLKQQLNEHPAMFPKVQIINDVYDIIPLPRPVVTCLRKVSSWLGLEILYDALGEYVFDIYTQSN